MYLPVYKHSTYMNGPNNNKKQPKCQKLSSYYILEQKHFDYLKSNDLVDDDDWLPLFHWDVQDYEQVHTQRFMFKDTRLQKSHEEEGF